MPIRRKTVKGRFYYYLERSIRLERPKSYSIYLGAKIPQKKDLKNFEKKLTEKIYEDLLQKTKNIHLTKEKLIDIEKKRLRYESRLKNLSKGQREQKDEVDIVNFVYTTLSTEGVAITKEDANLAYRFSNKEVRSVRDENLRISLDMIKGLRYVRESPKGLTIEFILNLHAKIMSEFSKKNPGKIRTKSVYIYLKNYEKVEEISFRPPNPKNIKKLFGELILWYNKNIGNINAIELAALLHLKFYCIHPFEDGNKRISRLLLNKALYDCNYPILNISKKSQAYFDALIKSVETKNDSFFVEFVAYEFEKMCSKRGL